ncbi:MAG: sensor histidine kinase [Mycobacterium leprae]
MKRRSLRTWLSYALIAVIVTPLAAFVGAMVLVRGPAKDQLSPWETKAFQARWDAVRLIAEHPAEWTMPSFQQQLEALGKTGGFQFTLLDDHGRVVYSTSHLALSLDAVVQSSIRHQVGQWGGRTLPTFGDSQIGVVQADDGRVTGTYILEQTQTDPWQWFFLAAAIGGLITAAVLAVRRISQAVNQPVQALAQASRLINEGRLDFELPVTDVRELSELATAFAVMREGLQRSIIAQAAMEQQRRFFVSAVAHDLRTPLTSVRGYLEGIQDGMATTPERVQQYVAVALAKTGQLERLVQDLFVYAKTEYLSQPPAIEPLELGDLLTTAVEAMRPRAESAGVSLQLVGDGEGAVAGDRLMLARVVDNLLDNAVRFTPPGGSVTVGWECSAGECRFWVQDTGPGIPEADLPFLFQPLFRGDQARSSRSGGGAGLGLSIVQRLVAAHGGRVAATNVDGGGARFTVTLPQAPVKR